MLAMDDKEEREEYMEGGGVRLGWARGGVEGMRAGLN